MQSWLGVALVAVGGAIGAVARHASNEYFRQLTESKWSRFCPLSTLVVNVVGCLAIGCLMALHRRGVLSDEWRLLVVTGGLGALTTFSAFGFETLDLARSTSIGISLANVAANVMLSLAAVWIGWQLCRGG